MLAYIYGAMWYPLKDQKIEFCSLSLLKYKYKYWMRAFLRIQKLLLGEEFSSAFVRNGQKRNCIFRNLHVWIELLYHSRYGVICIRLIYIALLIDFFFISVFRVPVSGVFAEKTT